MDQGTTLLIIESALRIVFGLRFLSSGISNVLGWPLGYSNCQICFPARFVLFWLGGNGLDGAGWDRAHLRVSDSYRCAHVNRFPDSDLSAPSALASSSAEYTEGRKRVHYERGGKGAISTHR